MGRITDAHSAMKYLVVALSLVLMSALLAGCGKPTAGDVEIGSPIVQQPAATPDPAPSTLATPVITARTAPIPVAPAPVASIPVGTTPVATPAPLGTYFLLTSERLETSHGIIRFKPGTELKLVRPGVYRTSAGEIPLRPDQVTNDVAIAQGIAPKETPLPPPVVARLAPPAAPVMPVAQAPQQQPVVPGAPVARSVPFVPGPADAVPWKTTSETASAATPVPGAKPMGSSSSLNTLPLNTTHSKTKDNVFTDENGRQYWRDIFGRAHYF